MRGNSTRKKGKFLYIYNLKYILQKLLVLNIKLIGFTEKFPINPTKENNENQAPDEANKTKKTQEPKPQADTFVMKSPILQIKQLLKVLSSPFYDGRILLNIDSSRSTLKFILLNPSVCFEEIIASARSVILAGGTMKPVRNYYA